jgi:hypothetical protein
MANLMMLAGLGFLSAGALAGGGRLGTGRAVIAATLCILFLLAVKFVQIWFPPRTVTINYVLAQTWAPSPRSAYGSLHERLRRAAAAISAGASQALTVLLAGYTALLVAFPAVPVRLHAERNGPARAPRAASRHAARSSLPGPPARAESGPRRREHAAAGAARMLLRRTLPPPPASCRCT